MTALFVLASIAAIFVAYRKGSMDNLNRPRSPTEKAQDQFVFRLLQQAWTDQHPGQSLPVGMFTVLSPKTVEEWERLATNRYAPINLNSPTVVTQELKIRPKGRTLQTRAERIAKGEAYLNSPEGDKLWKTFGIPLPEVSQDSDSITPVPVGSGRFYWNTRGGA